MAEIPLAKIEVVITMDKNIILATGKYLKENVVCSDKDIQHFLITELDYVNLPLKNIRDVLDVLAESGFLEKTGETYSPKYFQYQKKKEQKFDQTPVRQWHRDMLTNKVED
jgi:hypothetical protein